MNLLRRFRRSQRGPDDLLPTGPRTAADESEFAALAFGHDDTVGEWVYTPPSPVEAPALWTGSLGAYAFDVAFRPDVFHRHLTVAPFTGNPTQEHTMTDTFTRVDDDGTVRAPALDEYVTDPIAAADPILRRLGRAGRSGLMEAIAEHLDEPDQIAVDPFGAVRRTSARFLRILAARERKA